MYALVDCNNFFASCERVCNPKLHNTPIVVLSNNDGCIVARSNEVKKLGVPMGAPYFKWKDLLKKHNVHVCSSNFTLYGDFSKRVMSILQQHSFVDTIYSVDEAFLDLSGLQDPEAHAKELRAILLQWTGIPVSIGIGPTKTLAKLTNEYAKQHPECGGVLSFEKEGVRENIFSLPVKDVWGIGWRSAQKLNILNVWTVEELLRIPFANIRARFGVGLERTVLELRGMPCEKYTHVKDDRKSIIRSRSFRKKVMDKRSITEAVSSHIMTASRKLRSLGLGARHMTVYFRSSAHEKGKKYSATDSHTFLTPINNTFMLIKEALRIVDQTYIPGVRYAKAGVVFSELAPIDKVQSTLFDDDQEQQRSHKIFDTVDALNKKFGNDTIRLGAMGIKQDWSMKKEWRSNKFTSDWNGIIIAK